MVQGEGLAEVGNEDPPVMSVVYIGGLGAVLPFDAHTAMSGDVVCSHTDGHTGRSYGPVSLMCCEKAVADHDIGNNV